MPGGRGDLRELHSFTPASLRNTEQQLNSTLNVEPEECYLCGILKRNGVKLEKITGMGNRSDRREERY